MSRTSIQISTSPTGLRRNSSGSVNTARKTDQINSDECRRIIGIDPGLASTGWGVLEFQNEKFRYIAHGCIETEAGSPRGERLFFIYQSFVKILKTYNPCEAAMENLYFGRNISSAMTVSEARGVLLMTLTSREIPTREMTPNAIKKAVVGVTKADKSQIQEMVRFILGLPDIPKPDHSADALGAAICAAHLKIFPADASSQVL